MSHPLDPDTEHGRLRAEYVRRLAGVVSPSFHTRTVLVVGLGAGSHMVEKLARLCPAEIRICDFDDVEVHNLARTVYTFEDAAQGRSKTEALTRRLQAVNPTVRVVPYRCRIDALCEKELVEMFAGVHLVVAGTDQFQAQALINAWAVRAGIPAIFVGIFAGAQGGRIVGYLPGQTGCYRCCAAERYEQAGRGGEDATDRNGEAGSVADSQFIDMVALKLLMAVLERGEDSQAGRFLARLGDRTDVILRCDPDFDFARTVWDCALSDLPGDQSAALHGTMLHAMDSLWLSNPPQPLCPVCGGAR